MPEITLRFVSPRPSAERDLLTSEELDMWFEASAYHVYLCVALTGKVKCGKMVDGSEQSAEDK